MRAAMASRCPCSPARRSTAPASNRSRSSATKAARALPASRSRSIPVDSRWARWRSTAAASSATPSSRVATVLTMGGSQKRASSGDQGSPAWKRWSPSWSGGGRVAVERRSSSIIWRSRTVRSAPSRSALFTAKTSAISSTPALMAWTSSPSPGTETTTTVWASAATSISSWPTPTVSTSTSSLPMASITVTTSAVARERPPRLPRVAMERMKTPSSRAWSCMRMRSPRMAPPEKGLVGSTATTPTVFPCRR
jgi:hypothetical protein